MSKVGNGDTNMNFHFFVRNNLGQWWELLRRKRVIILININQNIQDVEHLSLSSAARLGHQDRICIWDLINIESSAEMMIHL